MIITEIMRIIEQITRFDSVLYEHIEKSQNEKVNVTQLSQIIFSESNNGTMCKNEALGK